MKGYAKIAIEILVKNATTVTGSAITLKQAKTTGGASEKALAFSTIYENLDTENSSTGDTLTEAAVSSSTFTTNTTNNKSLYYLIEVDASDLDVVNGFTCVRLGTGDSTAATLSVTYHLIPIISEGGQSAI